MPMALTTWGEQNADGLPLYFAQIGDYQVQSMESESAAIQKLRATLKRHGRTTLLRKLSATK